MAAQPGEGKKRLFFALWPDDGVRKQIATPAARAIEGAGGNAVPAVNWHITLAFLGAVSASSVADIVEVARGVRFLPFVLTLDRTGYWPRSQVAWVAPQQYPLQLGDLVDNLWNKLSAMGFQQEARQYRPHVTLGRRVSGGFGTVLPRPITWEAHDFVLVESLPGNSGPIYTPLEHFGAGA